MTLRLFVDVYKDLFAVVNFIVIDVEHSARVLARARAHPLVLKIPSGEGCIFVNMLICW